MSYATDTLTGQQRAVAVLAAILATPGLAPATWSIRPDSMCIASDTARLEGQLSSRQSIDDLRAAIDAYFIVFGLRLDEDAWMPGTDYCAAFTEVSTSGLIDGVRVKVWGAGR